MMKTLMFAMVSLLFAVAIAPAVASAEPNLNDGQWHRATLEIDADHEIPFFLWLPEDDSNDAIIRNGAEDMAVAFKRTRAIINLDFPRFDSRIVAQMLGDEYHGKWRKTRPEGSVFMWFSARPLLSYNSPTYRLFSWPGICGTFINWDQLPVFKIEPRWRIVFAESGVAIGRFEGADGNITDQIRRGTIETATGDYCYLSGNGQRNLGIGWGNGWPFSLKLSFFDGAHAYLFDAAIDEASQHMIGDFYSGNWLHETFTAEVQKTQK